MLQAALLAWRRWSLWVLLAALVVSVLVTLVWLAGRYEASQVQSKLERDAAEAVTDIRSALALNAQSLQALQAPDRAAPWGARAAQLLRERRELLRIERRSPGLALQEHADTPFRPPLFDRMHREDQHFDTTLACATARRFNGPAYSSTYFLPRVDGLGVEVIDLCMPLTADGSITGYLVATYSLREILSNLIGRNLTRSQEVSFTEVDGTRLALHGSARRGTRMFTAQQLLDLPGTTLVLRIENWHSPPSVFPNVLAAVVTAMSIALISVLVLLARDMRRRLQAEHDLADALAFRKAMEDSLVTGLRARGLDGRITYVNPAFSKLVGFAPEELLGQASPLPYWPPEHHDEYQQRQAIRFAGKLPPREGFESVFMHKNGTRFPVLVIEAPLIDAHGRQSGWMGVFLDLREQRRAEEITRASQERLQATARLATVGEMASLLSHELNQPLAAIASYATGSLNLLAPPDGAAPGPTVVADVQMALERIARQAARAGKVIKSVHSFVRRRESMREAMRAQDLLDAIMPLAGMQAHKLGMRLLTEVEPHLPSVVCDRTMVEQVLLNLARNAMQAMDDPSVRDRVVRITAARAASNDSGGWILFSVADLGVGITPEVADRMGTPFFTTKAEGMGLGLSLCRTVVEQHGGLFEFVPNVPRGTVFRFTLPAYRPKVAISV
ncbi:two-component system sensor histidine kinase NtrB [Xylophilus sp.]|uniref:two-component system sensor histidine kinase NtrB n=1 Tax=Xylophilus sp. TaxID=2653893 RepID=UPI002D7E1655|nr:ATP-binding protein [Xylophilus sp.]